MTSPIRYISDHNTALSPQRQYSSLSQSRLTPTKAHGITVSHHNSSFQSTRLNDSTTMSTSFIHGRSLAEKDQLLAKADEILKRSPQKNQRRIVWTTPQQERVVTQKVVISPEDEVFERSARLLTHVNHILTRSFIPQPFTATARQSMRASAAKSAQQRVVVESPSAAVDKRTRNAIQRIEEQLSKSSSHLVLHNHIHNSTSRNVSFSPSRTVHVAEVVHSSPPRALSRTHLAVKETPIILVTPPRTPPRARDSVIKAPTVATSATVTPTHPYYNLRVSQAGAENLKVSQHSQGRTMSPNRNAEVYVARKINIVDINSSDHLKRSGVLAGFHDVTVESRPLTGTSDKTTTSRRSTSPSKTSMSHLHELLDAALVRSSGNARTPKKEQRVVISEKRTSSPIIERITAPNSPEKPKHVEEKYDDGTHYKGDKLGNIRHGNGELSYANGSTYTGEWKNNKRDGYGSLTSKTGEKEYDGDWKDDQYEGSGTLVNLKPNQNEKVDLKDFDTVKNGWTRYEGEFSKGKKNGFGTLVLVNSEKFVGQFANNKAHGPGTFHKADGSLLVGEWADNKLVKTL